MENKCNNAKIRSKLAVIQNTLCKRICLRNGNYNCTNLWHLVQLKCYTFYLFCVKSNNLERTFRISEH